MKRTIRAFYILSFLTLISCNEKSKSRKTKDEIKIMSRDTTFNIGLNKSNYLKYSYQDSVYNFDFFNDNNIEYQDTNFVSSYKISDDGILNEKRNRNFFGEEELYLFDFNNSLYLMKRYVRNVDHGNGFYIQDIIAFNNGIIDEKNSNYIDVKILETKKDKVLLEINYVSGNKFFSGEIHYGGEAKSTKEAKKLKKLIMNSKSEQFWVAKKDFIYDDFYISFSVTIHRDVVSGIYGWETHVPKGQKEFKQFFIVRRLIESPMRPTK